MRARRLLVSAALAATGLVLVPAGGTGATAPTGALPASEAKRPLLLPNARALAAAKPVIVRTAAGGRVLRFESGLANVGHGVLEVRPNSRGGCSPREQHASQILFRDRDGNGWFDRSVDRRYVRRDAGCMLFHPAHDHWHFEAAARYALWRAGGETEPVVVRGRKMSFCLRDTERAPDRWPTPTYPLYYGECHRSTPQGISIGWVDIYGAELPGQSLTLPRGLRSGLYCLRTTVDPLDQLRESDNTDNSSVRALRIRGERVSTRPTGRCRAVL